MNRTGCPTGQLIGRVSSTAGDTRLHLGGRAQRRERGFAFIPVVRARIAHISNVFRPSSRNDCRLSRFPAAFTPEKRTRKANRRGRDDTKQDCSEKKERKRPVACSLRLHEAWEGNMLKSAKGKAPKIQFSLVY